jgi:hypothetical protein
MALAEVIRPEKMRIHTYHGEANLLDLDVIEPFQEKVNQGKVELQEGKGDRSHYKFERSGPYNVKGVISYQSGYTQVGAARSMKHERRYSTLVTSAIEGLNILDILTADRVVAQITTAHPIDGAVPEVSFLGTRFENLRIGGHKVELDTNLEILGPRPVGDTSYFDNQRVMDRMEEQHERLTTSDYFPDWARERYARPEERWRLKNNDSGADIAKCSLVNRVNCDQRSFGHVIDVPHYGKFFLGEVKVKRTPACKEYDYDTYNFQLTMVRMELGCTTTLNGGASSAESNGGGSQGTGSGSGGKGGT